MLFIKIKQQYLTQNPILYSMMKPLVNQQLHHSKYFNPVVQQIFKLNQNGSQDKF